MYKITDDEMMRMLGLESGSSVALNKESASPVELEDLEKYDKPINAPSLKLTEELNEVYITFKEALNEYTYCYAAMLYYSARKTVARSDYDKHKHYTKLTETLNRNQLSESSTSIGFNEFMCGLGKEIVYKNTLAEEAYHKCNVAFIDLLSPLVLGDESKAITILLSKWRNDTRLKDSIKSRLDGDDSIAIVNGNPVKLYETPIRELVALANDYSDKLTSPNFIEITALLKELEDRIKDTTFITVLSKCVSTTNDTGLILDPTLRDVVTAIYQDSFINEVDVLRAEVLKHFNNFSVSKTEELTTMILRQKLQCYCGALGDVKTYLITLNHVAATLKRVAYVVNINDY